MQTYETTIQSFPVAYMILRKKDDIFKELQIGFGIADYILIVGSKADDRDSNTTLRHMMQICQQENMKLNKNKCHFRCIRILFFDKILSRDSMQQDPGKLHALTEMPPPVIKRITIILRFNEVPRKILTFN